MKVFIARQASLLLLAVLLMTSFAEAADLDLAPQNRGPVNVTANRLQADDNKQVLVFSGDAVATQEDVTIHADRLIIQYTGEKREIEQLIAEGHVRITQQDKVATGDRAVFYQREERIVLTGAAQVTQGENSVKGQEITLFLKDQRSIVTAGEGGRVKAVFTPQTGDQP